MGYETLYQLDVFEEDGTTLINDPALNDEILDDGNLTVELLLESQVDPTTWYIHQEEMAALSKKYPKYVFVLYGDGEESGDIWEECYLNGHFYCWELKYVIIPKVDVEKLKSSPTWTRDDWSLFTLGK